MKIYFKCSFKSSDGYRTGLYDISSKQLTYISDCKDEYYKYMSEAVAQTLQNQLGRTMCFASDEHDKLFVGVYNLIEGNYDKYVNAVFMDDDRILVSKVFLYFCKNYRKANELLMHSVNRMDNSLLGFLIDENIIDSFIRTIKMESKGSDYKQIRSSTLIAFVSKDKYEDYQLNLADTFDTRYMIKKDNVSDMESQVFDLSGFDNVRILSVGIYQKRKAKLIAVTVALMLIAYIVITGLILHYFDYMDKNGTQNNLNTTSEITDKEYSVVLVYKTNDSCVDISSCFF